TTCYRAFFNRSSGSRSRGATRMAPGLGSPSLNERFASTVVTSTPTTRSPASSWSSSCRSRPRWVTTRKPRRMKVAVSLPRRVMSVRLAGVVLAGTLGAVMATITHQGSGRERLAAVRQMSGHKPDTGLAIQHVRLFDSDTGVVRDGQTVLVVADR